MADLKEVVAYLLKEYPFKNELSNARVTKLVFLADWLSAIRYEKQLTDIAWFYDNYGPFVWDVKDCVSHENALFSIVRTSNIHGEDKTLFRLRNPDYEPDLSLEDQEILDRVIEDTEELNWEDFIGVVYSTHPIFTSDQYTTLNLVKKAREYNEWGEE